MHFDIVKITRPELAAAIRVQRTLMQELELIQRSSERDGCKACVHFVGSTNSCNKHAQQVPPEFIKDGCDEWSYDAIPF